MPLAAASKRFRVITRDDIQKRIEQALEADRKLRAERLHEEAKARILEARATLQEAIREIERIKAREAELLARIEQLQNENGELREELRHFVENAKVEPVAPAVTTNGHSSSLVERSAWDSLAARVARLEELLAAHLLQDHRGQSEEDPPESNGRSKRRRLR